MTDAAGEEGCLMRLPKDSYTVYRLRYGDAQELYLTSRVVFLGKIPNVWLMDKKSVLLNRIYRLRAINKAKHLLAEEITAENFDSLVHRDGEIQLQLNQTLNDNIETTNVSEKAKKHGPKIKSFLLNLKHREEVTTSKASLTSKISAPAIVIDSNAEKQKLKSIPDEKLGSISYFTTPRKSVELENAEFCKLFVPDEDSVSDTGNVSDHTADSDEAGKTEEFISAVHLKHSKSFHNRDKDEGLQSRTDLFVRNLAQNTTNQSNQSSDDFLSKSLLEKQEILRIEINDAMLALNQQKDTTSQEMEKSSSDETYYSASEEVDPTSIFDDNLKNLNVPQGRKTTKSVKFLGTELPNSKQNSSTYLLGSSKQKFQLNEQNPIPAALEDDTVFKGDDCSIESPFGLDDKSTETYRILKSNSLATKFASTMETRLAERKHKLSLILKRFEEGEIIKIEKMLVMSYYKDKVGLEEHSTKNAEKWKEYVVVVRATSDVDYPAMIQFYKTNRILKKDDVFDLKHVLFEESLHNVKTKTKEEINEYSPISSDEENDDTILVSDAAKHTLSNSNTSKSLLSMLKRNTDKKRKKIRKQNDLHSKKGVNDDKKEILKENTLGISAASTIVISKYDTEVLFANVLDKSILINKTKGSRVISYIMLAHSTTSAMTWVSFLQQLLDPRDTTAIVNNSLMINIPALNISLDIIGEKALLDSILQEQSHSIEFLSVMYYDNGYRFEKPEIFGFILNMLKRRLHVLEKANVLSQNSSTREFLDKLYSNEARLALAFKRYDRLEWILGENKSLVQILWNCIGSSYDLEIREYKHDSHHILHKVSEPTPVEGFVIKLSDRLGRLTTPFGKHYFKLFYAFTSDNILFFQNFYRAVPAFPTTNDKLLPNTFISAAGEVHNVEQLDKAAKFDSTVFSSSPYPLKDQHISWLSPETTLSEYYENDEYALYDAERRSGLISSAHSMIDLTKVQDVRKVAKENVSPLLKTSANLIWGTNSKDDFEEETDFQQNCFELVMVDQTVVRLNVCSGKIRDEWVTRLKEISQYWALKKSQELKKISELREKNLAILKTSDDQFESVIASQVMNLSSKQEFSKAQADSEIYSISSYVLDKPILQCGYVYCRLLSGKQFEKLYAVLSPGFIVLYKVFNRSKASRVAQNSAYYKKVRTIPLSTCYVFSQVGRSHAAYISMMGNDSKVDYSGTPRVYEDGWRSTEPPVQRLFTVWVGSKKILIKDRKEKKGRKNVKQSESINNKYLNSTLIQSSSENESGLSDDEHESVGKKFGDALKRTVTNTSQSNQKASDEENEPDLEIPESEIDNAAEFKRVPMEEERMSPIEMLKRVSKLGVAGEGFLFLVRSRMERDIWVTRLMTEIERFSSIRNNDISLV